MQFPSNQSMSPINKEATVFARQENTATIPLGQNYNFSSGNPDHQLNLDFNQSYRDMIGYYNKMTELNGSSTYTQTPNNQILDFLPTFNSTTGRSKFQIYNGSFLISYLGSTDQNIGPGAVIDIDLHDFYMNVSPGTESYFKLEVTFDSFRVVLSYFDTNVGANSSIGDPSVIFLTQSTPGRFRESLSDLVSMVNATYPSKFKGILLTVRSLDYFDFSAEFNHITVLNSIANFNYTLQNSVQNYNGSSVTLNPRQTEEFQVNLPYDITTDLIWSHNFNYNQTLHILPYLRNSSLFANLTINHSNGYPGYSYYYHFWPMYSEFSITENSTMFHNQTYFWYNYHDPLSFVISGVLQEISSNIVAQSPRQNSLLHFDNFPKRSWEQLSLYHLPSGGIVSYNSSEPPFIPQQWSRGGISGYVIWNNGTYSNWIMSLKLSPVGLSSPNVYRIHTGQRYIFPVELVNLTSTLHFNPTRIVSTINTTQWRIDGSLGILVEAGDLPVGTTHITVNATSWGYNPFVFDLSITVTAEVINPTVDINRVAVNQTELGLYLPVMRNRTAGGSIHVTGEGLNQTSTISGYFTSMVLVTSNWTASASYQIQLTVNLDYHPLIFRYNITIGPVQDNSSSPPYATIISATTLLLLGVSVIYRIYSSKFSDNVIQF